MAKRILPYFWKAGPLIEFYSERLLMDLTIMILGKVTIPGAAPERSGLLARVEAAENWYRTHLARRPNLTNLARETGTSEGHLRRLFLSERNCTPKVAMTQIQIARARELLAGTDFKLDVVAVECGFLDASGFCKTFKKAEGMTPTEYRIRFRKA